MCDQLIKEYLIFKRKGQLIPSLRLRVFLSLLAATGTAVVLQLKYKAHRQGQIY